MKISEIKNAIYFDTETTGLDLRLDKIVEYGCLRVRNQEITEELRLLVKQPIRIPLEASNIHGITNEMVEKDGIDPESACKQVLAFFGDDPVIGINNIPYDLPLLEVECKHFNLPRPHVEKWFDIGMFHKGMQIGNVWNGQELFYRYALRIREIRAKGVKYNLDHLSKVYETENLRDNSFHGALRDSRMVFYIFKKMQLKYPEV